MQKGLKELQVVKVRHLAELRDLSDPGMVGRRVADGNYRDKLSSASFSRWTD